MRNLFAFSILPIAASLALPASAAQITFDDLAHSGTYITLDEYTSQGFVFTNTSGIDDFMVWGAANSAYNADPDGATLINFYNSSRTTVARAGGGMFDLTSIDLADLYNNGTPVTVEFDFTTALATTSQTVTLDAFVGLQTFTFDKIGLNAFSYRVVGNFAQVDNVNLSAAAVPEPASWAMLIVGFAAIGGAMRRKTKLAFAA